MFCHSCGSQVAPDVAFCPTCGQSLTSPSAAAPPTFVAPVGVKATPGRWISAAWRLVQADLGNTILVSLVFVLLNGVPLIQGALIAGFHYFVLKKLLGRRAEFADLFKGFNFFVPTLIASLVIGLFVFGGPARNGTA